MCEAWLAFRLEKEATDEAIDDIRNEYQATLKLIQNCQTKIDKL